MDELEQEFNEVLEQHEVEDTRTLDQIFREWGGADYRWADD